MKYSDNDHNTDLGNIAENCLYFYLELMAQFENKDL